MKGFIVGLALAAVAAGATAIAVEDNLNKKIDELNATHQEELNVMQDALDKSAEELNNYKLLLAQQATELDSTKTNLAKKETQLLQAQTSLTEKEALIVEKDEQIAELQTALETSENLNATQKAEYEAQIATLQAEKEMLIAEKVELQTQVDSLTAEVVSLNEQIDSLIIEVETYKGQLGIANTAAYFNFSGEEIIGYSGPEEITDICFPASYSLGEIVTETKAFEDYFTLRTHCRNTGIWNFTISNEATEETITITSEKEFNNNMSTIRTYFTNYGSSNITYQRQTYVDGDDYQVKAIAASAFHSNTTLTGVAFAEGIETINDYAFSGCTSIIKITLPDSLKFLGDYNFQDLDTSIYTQEGNGYYFSSPTNPTFCLVKAVDTAIEEITINENTVIIGPRALISCTALKDIIIPDNVVYLGDYSIGLKTTADSISLPNNVILGTSVFWSSHFKNVIWEKTDEENGYTFKDGKLTITSITDGIIDSTGRWGSWPQLVTSVEFSENLNPTSMTQAFRYSSITSIELPSSITQFGQYAFSETLLTSIDLSHLKITDLNETFAKCAFLETVILPESIITIGQGAFEYCYALKAINIPGAVTTIGYGAFRYCTSITEVSLPSTVTSVGNYAFSNCTALEKVTVNGLIENLHTNNFSECTALSAIYVPQEHYDTYYASSYLVTIKDLLVAF